MSAHACERNACDGDAEVKVMVFEERQAPLDVRRTDASDVPYRNPSGASDGRASASPACPQDMAFSLFHSLYFPHIVPWYDLFV